MTRFGIDSTERSEGDVERRVDALEAGRLLDGDCQRGDLVERAGGGTE